jgi:hypothetical protein
MPGKPGLVRDPIQVGSATLAICTMINITIMPEMIGTRRCRANSPTKLLPRIGTVSTHQISEAAKKEPNAVPKPPACKWPTVISAPKLPAYGPCAIGRRRNSTDCRIVMMPHTMNVMPYR